MSKISIITQLWKIESMKSVFSVVPCIPPQSFIYYVGIAFNNLDTKVIWHLIKTHRVGKENQDFTGFPAKEMVAPVARDVEGSLLVFLCGNVLSTLKLIEGEMHMIEPARIAQSVTLLIFVHKQY